MHTVRKVIDRLNTENVSINMNKITFTVNRLPRQLLLDKNTYSQITYDHFPDLLKEWQSALRYHSADFKKEKNLELTWRL